MQPYLGRTSTHLVGRVLRYPSSSDGDSSMPLNCSTPASRWMAKTIGKLLLCVQSLSVSCVVCSTTPSSTSGANLGSTAGAAPPQPPSSPASKTPVIVGVSVGVGAVLALAFVIFFCFKLRRRRRRVLLPQGPTTEQAHGSIIPYTQAVERYVWTLTQGLSR